MNDESADGEPRWYTIRVHPKQENRADHNLRAGGWETLYPKLKELCRNPFTSELVYMVKPLFPRYIFAKFEANQMLHNINYTRGVQSVVGFGNGPVALDEEVIAIIKSRIGEDGLIQIGEKLNVGDRVLITDGPFKSLIGLFERQMPAADRAMILLCAVSYQGHVSIEKDLLRKVS